MLIQGSNNPLVITLDTSVDTIPDIVVTLWDKMAPNPSAPIVKWEKADMTIDNKTLICPLTEEQTKTMPRMGVIIEVKGLDDNGMTMFWAGTDIDVLNRRDRIINLTQIGG